MAEDPQLRLDWDNLVGRAVADDPVLTALDMGTLEGMSAWQVELFFRTIESAIPTDAELLEQSRRETADRTSTPAFLLDLEANARYAARQSLYLVILCLISLFLICAAAFTAGTWV